VRPCRISLTLMAQVLHRTTAQPKNSIILTAPTAPTVRKTVASRVPVTAVFMFAPTFAFVMMLVTAVPLQTPAVSTHAQNGYAGDRWLLSYQGKSTNRVRWDPRLANLLQNGLPSVHTNFYDPHMLLPDVALISLSGPPQPVSIESNRYVTLAACVPQVGELKGLLWVDTGAHHPEMIFAALDQDAAKLSEASLALYTRSNPLATRLPPQFVSSLATWMTNKGIRKVTRLTMTKAEGQTTQLPLAVLGSY
jgi:hypothetical protein